MIDAPDLGKRKRKAEEDLARPPKRETDITALAEEVLQVQRPPFTFQAPGPRPVPTFTSCLFENKKSITALIATCTDLETALAVLCNETVISQFSIADAIELVAMHSPLLEMIITQRNELLELLPEYLKIPLAKYHPFMIDHLNLNEIFERFVNTSQGELGRLLAPLANHIFNPIVAQKLNGYDLTTLGMQSLAIAQSIASTPALYQKLDLDNLVRLGENHLFIAKHILSRPEIYSKLKGEHFASLAKNHYQLAVDFLNDNTICSKLHNEDFVVLSQNEPTLAFLITNTKAITDGFNEESFLGIAKHHLFFAEKIFNHPGWCESVSGVKLAEVCQHHLTLAQQILKTPQLSIKLTGNDLVTLSRHLPPIAQHIRITPELFKRLNQYNLERMCYDHIGIADSVAHSSTALPLSHRAVQIVSIIRTIAWTLQERMHEKAAGMSNGNHPARLTL